MHSPSSALDVLLDTDDLWPHLHGLCVTKEWTVQSFEFTQTLS